MGAGGTTRIATDFPNEFATLRRRLSTDFSIIRTNGIESMDASYVHEVGGHFTHNPNAVANDAEKRTRQYSVCMRRPVELRANF